MTEENLSVVENNRQYEVVGQMLSMHSSYRDRLERRAFWLSTLLVAASVFMTVLGFIEDGMLSRVGLDPGAARFILGMIGVFMLVCSIADMRVDWRSVAGRHGEAADRLADLKAKFRKAHTETAGNDLKKNARLTTEYDKVMSDLPPIPDRWFNTLKAQHQFKRLFSQRISRCPKAPKCYLWLQLRIEGIGEARQLAKDRKHADQSNAN